MKAVFIIDKNRKIERRVNANEFNKYFVFSACKLIDEVKISSGYFSDFCLEADPTMKLVLLSKINKSPVTNCDSSFVRFCSSYPNHNHVKKTPYRRALSRVRARAKVSCIQTLTLISSYPYFLP